MPPVLELFLLRRFLVLAPLEMSMQKVFEQHENDWKENMKSMLVNNTIQDAPGDVMTAPQGCSTTEMVFFEKCPWRDKQLCEKCATKFCLPCFTICRISLVPSSLGSYHHLSVGFGWFWWVTNTLGWSPSQWQPGGCYVTLIIACLARDYPHWYLVDMRSGVILRDCWFQYSCINCFNGAYWTWYIFV